MNIDEFRQLMASFRHSVYREAREFKESCYVTEQFKALYRKFDSAERELAATVLSDWALSDDEGLRFDALSLIDEFTIASTRKALQELARRLTHSKAVSAPYDLKKVNRIIENLGKQ